MRQLVGTRRGASSARVAFQNFANTINRHTANQLANCLQVAITSTNKRDRLDGFSIVGKLYMDVASTYAAYSHKKSYRQAPQSVEAEGAQALKYNVNTCEEAPRIKNTIELFAAYRTTRIRLEFLTKGCSTCALLHLSPCCQRFPEQFCRPLHVLYPSRQEPIALSKRK